jgi:hypothetical protein
VLVWEPPHRVILAWHLNPNWTFDPDPAKASHVEIHFTSEGPTNTLVKLTHSKAELHGENPETLRAVFDGPGAWERILINFAEAAR